MDHCQFDLLTRRLGNVPSRRTLLGNVISALVAFAAAGSTRGVGGQEACAGGCPEDHVCLDGGCYRPCANHRDCRSKRDDPCISNTCVEGFCITAIVDCLPGFECCRGECCPKSCEFDAECVVVDPCRWGSCSPEGQCVFTEIEPCPVCTSDEDCAANSPNTACCDGVCQRPCPEGTVMGKGCECGADASAILDGLIVRDDASG